MRIVCFCGIDGSGKSTLIDKIKTSALAENFLFKSFNYRDNVAQFINQNPKIDISSINRYSYRAKSRLVDAYAIDFVNFYKNEIESLEDTKKIILCDRWFHDILAFESSLSVKSKITEKLFTGINKGDLIFYINAIPEIAYKRQLRVGILSKKNLSLLVDYYNGYNNYFKNSNLIYFEVHNNKNIDKSLNIIIKELENLIR